MDGATPPLTSFEVLEAPGIDADIGSGPGVVQVRGVKVASRVQLAQLGVISRLEEQRRLVDVSKVVVTLALAVAYAAMPLAFGIRASEVWRTVAVAVAGAATLVALLSLLLDQLEAVDQRALFERAAALGWSEKEIEKQHLLLHFEAAERNQSLATAVVRLGYACLLLSVGAVGAAVCAGW